jgi:hypothetical protein
MSLPGHFTRKLNEAWLASDKDNDLTLFTSFCPNLATLHALLDGAENNEIMKGLKGTHIHLLRKNKNTMFIMTSALYEFNESDDEIMFFIRRKPDNSIEIKKNEPEESNAHFRHFPPEWILYDGAARTPPWRRRSRSRSRSRNRRRTTHRNEI